MQQCCCANPIRAATKFQMSVSRAEQAPHLPKLKRHVRSGRRFYYLYPSSRNTGFTTSHTTSTIITMASSLAILTKKLGQVSLSQQTFQALSSQSVRTFAAGGLNKKKKNLERKSKKGRGDERIEDEVS